MTKKHLTRMEVAAILERFLDGTGGDWDWDDFTTATQLEDERLEAIRLRCAGLNHEFPPGKSGNYTSEEGLEVIRDYIKRLRTEAPERPGKP